MNNQEILEYNRKCAEFLCTNKNIINLDGFYFIHGIEYNLEDLDFNKDWNWIMEVVEKIESLGKIIIIDGTKCTITPLHSSYILSNNESKKEAAIEAISQFLTWYNANK